MTDQLGDWLAIMATHFILSSGTTDVLNQIELDHSCNKYYDLIDQEVSISHKIRVNLLLGA